MLADAANCLQGSIELKLPNPNYAAAYELKPGSFNQAASDPDVTRHMDECLADWCRQVGSSAITLNTPCMALVHACTGWRDRHHQQLAAGSTSLLPLPLTHGLFACCFCAEQVEGLLERSSAPPAGEEPGPDTELEHWRQQMSRLNSLTKQLKSHECRLVLGVTSMAHSQVGEAAHYAWTGQTFVD